MHFTSPVHRPANERRSIFLQVTSGCHHNACRFCTMYKDVPFEEAPLDLVEKQLERGGLPARDTLRRGVPVVYLKGAQQIADALALMEAPQAVMRLENIRITRQMRGEANRGRNCDEHNSERQLDAARDQEEAIRLLAIHAGLYTLPPALRQIAAGLFLIPVPLYNFRPALLQARTSSGLHSFRPALFQTCTVPDLHLFRPVFSGLHFFRPARFQDP